MIAIQFDVGGQRYAIDVADIVEVVPAVELRVVRGVAEGVVGVLRYHGNIVPVLDLSQLLAGTAAPRWLSTRLIILRLDRGNGAVQLLGVLAERATLGMTEEIDVEADVRPLGVASSTAPFLSAMTVYGEPSITFLTTASLLSEAQYRNVVGAASD